MGNRTHLYIDRLHFQWRNQLPSFLTFLFKPGDLYTEPAELGEDDEDEWYEEVGFRTSCRSSLEALDRQGYTVDFFSEIYDFFKDELEDGYRDCLEEEIARSKNYSLEPAEYAKLAEEHIGRFPVLDARQQLVDFSKFIGALYAPGLTSAPFDKPYRLDGGDGSVIEIQADEFIHGGVGGGTTSHYVDFESLQMYLLDRHIEFPPSILTVAQMFEEHFLWEYPEVISLMFTRLVLESASPDAEIRLEVRDFIEDLDEARQLHTTSARALAEKLHLYNRAFGKLVATEVDPRNAYIRAEVNRLLAECDQATTNAAKGRKLELLIETLFSIPDELQVEEKRLNTGDEEIDLTIRNNVQRPFWIGLRSPLLFVECKNWTSRVGSAEVRDFETKVRNHHAMTRLGFFVGLNGFTSEAANSLRRVGREDYHIVLIDRADISAYLNSNEDVLPWLERCASRLY